MEYSKKLIDKIIKEEIAYVLRKNKVLHEANIMDWAYDEQTGLPYGRFVDRSTDIVAAQIVSPPGRVRIDLGDGTHRVGILMRLWKRDRSYETVAFYTSSGTGTPGMVKSGQWVPHGGITYKGHLGGGSGAWEWIVKYPGGKINNKYRIVGKWLERAQGRARNFPKILSEMNKGEWNQLLQREGALRRDWIDPGSYQQFYGVDEIKKFTIAPDSALAYRLQGTRGASRHANTVLIKDKIAAEILSRREYKVFRDVQKWRHDNEHLYEKWAATDDAAEYKRINNKVGVEYAAQKKAAARKKIAWAGFGVGAGVLMPGDSITNKTKKSAKRMANKMLYKAEKLKRNIETKTRQNLNSATFARTLNAIDIALTAKQLYDILEDNTLSESQKTLKVLDLSEEIVAGAAVCLSPALSALCKAYALYSIYSLLEAFVMGEISRLTAKDLLQFAKDDFVGSWAKEEDEELAYDCNHLGAGHRWDPNVGCIYDAKGGKSECERRGGTWDGKHCIVDSRKGIGLEPELDDEGPTDDACGPGEEMFDGVCMKKR